MEFRSKHEQQQPQMMISRSSRALKPKLSTCKKHPKHQQSPGVCSICLSEKLSQLSTSSSRSNNTTVDTSSSSSSSLSSLSSSHYSASGSSCSSPVRRHHRHYRMASDGRGLSVAFFKSGKSILTKSRSLAFITRKKEVGVVEAHDFDHHGKKKGTSFWSKLLRPRNKRIDDQGLALPHSRTMNQRMATEIH